MPRVIDSPEEFTIVGENIHATRVLLRNGRRAKTLDDGTEVVPFRGPDGERRLLTVPEWYKSTQPYQQNQIKHFLIAMRKGIEDDADECEEGKAYIQYEVRRQVRAGAKYLDINPDEVHYDLETQKACMRFAVEAVQEISPIPPSIDSSNSEIIQAGLEAYDGSAGRPMINSVAAERLEALDMVVEHNARMVLMCTGPDGMPQNDGERVDNLNLIMEHVQSKGIPMDDIYVDGIIFPISVDPQYGNHYFDAVRTIREQYGNEIHIGMGLSNVSFGMPERRLLNDTFIYLSVEAGIDAGILDPIATKLERVFTLDTESEPVKLALDALEGRDDFCMNYIMAYRDGRLKA